MNADGFDDILIGAYAARPGGQPPPLGETYVVYGGADNLAYCDALDGAADGSVRS